jgi:hypothetical protein
MAGKGSKPRPFSVPKDQYDNNHETIFGKYVPRYLRNRTVEDIPVLENEEMWSQRVIDENSKDK